MMNNPLKRSALLTLSILAMSMSHAALAAKSDGAEAAPVLITSAGLPAGEASHDGLAQLRAQVVQLHTLQDLVRERHDQFLQASGSRLRSACVACLFRTQPFGIDPHPARHLAEGEAP